jgi:hypothetical protein
MIRGENNIHIPRQKGWLFSGNSKKSNHPPMISGKKLWGKMDFILWGRFWGKWMSKGEGVLKFFGPRNTLPYGT